MRKLVSKKAAAVVAGGAIVVIGAGTAYAYWSTTGTGSGSAATSAGVSSLSFSQTPAQQALNLYPGQAAQPIAGTVKNDSPQSAYVNTVTASIASVTQAAGASGTCDSSDYTLGGAPVPVASDLAQNATHAFGGQTIQFNNKVTNQDGCKGATVVLAFASN